MTRKKYFIRVLAGVFIFANLAMASLFVFHELLDFTSSNSAFYVLRGRTGGIELSRDLIMEDADRLLFMVDANCIFNFFMKGLAAAKKGPMLELTWNTAHGVGDFKQFRHDGTILSLSFSRYIKDIGAPKGLFLGGDLPYGDIIRAKDQETSGFGFYDGKEWHHIWCALNEALKLSGGDETAYPPTWRYLGSEVLKESDDELLLKSEHAAVLNGERILMKRFVSFRAGQDYFTMRIRITNANPGPITFDYAIGDEPWVGHFGGSHGDVGWNEGGLIEYEESISPVKYKYAGYWDRGNPAINEKGEFSGIANFIEWVDSTPSYVYFSNSFEKCCSEKTPLSSQDNRVLNIVWIDQLLMPGESRDYTFAIGMAPVRPGAPLPEKPYVLTSHSQSAE